MARFKISPKLAEYDKKIYELGAQAQTYIEDAVKKGANPVADAIRAGINALPVDDRYYVKPGELRTGIRTIQKIGLQESFGIAPVRNDKGFINVKVGFDGYNQLASRYYNGQPNTMIARSVERGTSFMVAHPFIENAVKSSRKQAEDIMRQEIDNSVGKIMGV